LKRAGVGAQIGDRQAHRYAFGEAQRKSDEKSAIGDKRQAVGDKEWATQIATKKKNKSDIKLKKRNLGIKKELR
jgi:hypothetical protein